MFTNTVTDEIIFCIPLLLLHSLIILTFFKVINASNLKTNYFDRLTQSTTNTGSFFLCFLFLLNVLYPLILQYFYFLHTRTSVLWASHLMISNYNLYLVLFSLGTMLYIVYIFYNIFFQKMNMYRDYFFSVINLITTIPYVFIVNNFYSLIFILEYINTIIFYKLISSKINKTNTTNHYKTQYSSKKYINILFFQFWSTFFSNMFFFYFFIYMLYKFGTTNWTFLNYLLVGPNFLLNVEWVQVLLVGSIFTLSVFLKLGSAPLHLFKVEIYDGLPYLSILFYTTFYVNVFFIFLIYFFYHLCFSIYMYIIPFFVYFITFGLIYMVFNSIFNIQLLKAFFAYSTILNVALFFLVFIVITL